MASSVTRQPTMAASYTPVWPTMSGGAKLFMTKGELVLGQALAHLVGHAVGRHLGREVVRGHALVGRHEVCFSSRVSSGKTFSTPPLKKKVTCAYFSVSATCTCSTPCFPQPLREHVAHVLRLEGDLEREVQLVLRHGDERDLGKREVGQRRRVDAAQQLHDLPHSVGAVVEEEDRVPI